MVGPLVGNQKGCRVGWPGNAGIRVTIKSYDAVVVGAGVFGCWTAWYLAQRKQRVLLVDAYGPANSRASSGGESRIIRMGYGADELYTRWSQRSLTQWREVLETVGAPLFHATGVLWLAGEGDQRIQQTRTTLKLCGVPFESLNRRDLERTYPQMGLDGIACGILETTSGVLLARRCVAAIVRQLVDMGVEYRVARVEASFTGSGVPGITTHSGERLVAEQFVFACGAWLAKLFPEVLGDRIFPTRQEVFFFGVPAGDSRYAPPALPTWLFQEDQYYGMPDLENRGLKVAVDSHGERVDPDTQSRIVSQQSAKNARAYIARRFPGLQHAPIVETRVCQYENTSSGDFLIDQHPQAQKVWFVGGGSGHGFKHGPAVGEYLVARMLDRASSEARFALATKNTVQQRAVY
jgi:sarcosine oxidase